MAFEVSLSPRAIADAEHAYLWFKEQNQTFANEWFQGLSDALASLEQLPARCPVAPESQELDREVRQLLYRKSKKATFRILFGISGEEVFVYRIRHTSQQYLTVEEF